jgi:carbamoyl-phosphate synthase large subunit
MKSVGETMSIGRSFNESLQKGFSSLEYGLDGLDVPQNFEINKQTILDDLKIQSSQRLLTIGQALRLEIPVEEINDITKYDNWFINQLNKIVGIEKLLKNNEISKEMLLLAKHNGFTDKKIAKIKNYSEKEVRKLRHQYNIRPIFRLVDTCAGEFNSETPYLYSSYDWNFHNKPFCESNPTSNKKVIILGGGPNRIGQGIEFDYCCVHAVYALKEKEIETIMINCNPETVSTDYDTADRLYFEPLTTESVLEIYKKEEENGEVLGVFVQFGGQTPLKIANELESEGVKILGTTTEAIDLAEDRDRFSDTLLKLKIDQPKNGFAKNLNEAKKIANDIDYPVLVRPSYVLGGRAMEIAYNEKHLESFTKNALEVSSNNIILVDQYLENATEVDVDLIRDSKGNIFIAGIMEHIEEAGIHSGDSACSLPPFSISDEIQNKIINWVSKIANEIKVIGLMNTQLAIKNENIYVLEVNPRASRTVPFVAKARGIPIAKIAAKVMTDDLLEDILTNTDTKKLKTYNVKESVFPFNKFDGVDLVLGPEMKSTGEVMGIDDTFLSAFAKSQIACGTILPSKGKVFISIDNDNKKFILTIVKKLINLNFTIIATKGTAKFLNDNNLNVEIINKVKEGGSHIVNAITENKIDLVINTTKTQGSIRDSYSIRRTSLIFNIPYYTTIAGAKVAVDTIEHLQNNSLKVKSLQDLV